MATQAETRLTCEELAELVTDYLEGAMSAGDNARFERHVALCPDCRRYLEQMRGVIRAAGKLPPEPIPPAVERQLLERFRGWKRERRPE